MTTRCTQMESRMHAALDGDAGAMGEVEAHAERCAACRSRWGALVALETDLAAAAEESTLRAPAGLAERIQARIVQEPPHAPRRARRAVWLSAAAALLAALVGGSALMLEGSGETPKAVPPADAAELLSFSLPTVSVPVELPSPAALLSNPASDLGQLALGVKTSVAGAVPGEMRGEF